MFVLLSMSQPACRPWMLMDSRWGVKPWCSWLLTTTWHPCVGLPVALPSCCLWGVQLSCSWSGEAGGCPLQLSWSSDPTNSWAIQSRNSVAYKWLEISICSSRICGACVFSSWLKTPAFRTACTTLESPVRHGNLQPLLFLALFLGVTGVILPPTPPPLTSFYVLTRP